MYGKVCHTGMTSDQEMTRFPAVIVHLTLSLLPKLPFVLFENENLGVCIKKFTKN